MKYIKIFESFNKKEIIQDCEDILLDARDKGFRIDINTWTSDSIAIFLTNPTKITVSGDLIGDDLIPNLDFQSEIKPCIEHLISFLKESGYKLESIYVINDLNPREVTKLNEIIKVHRLELRFTSQM